jgi:hypothetical protein
VADGPTGDPPTGDPTTADPATADGGAGDRSPTGSDAAPAGERGPTPAEPTSTAAAWAFGLYVAAALPLLLFVLGDHFWFLRDDWFFITDRELSSVDDLFRDHNGHWSTVPIVVFRGLYALVGIRSYLPYQAAVVGAHLLVAVLLRALMRRYGASPWLATAVAGSLVLLGTGREDIIWAFQVGYTSSLALVLAQWVLAEHDGPLGRRDLLGVAAGLLAVSAASPPLAIYPALAVTLLVRRGWRAAALHVGPVAAVYLLWSAIVHPDRSSPWGRPTAQTVVDWITHGQSQAFKALTGGTGVAVALAAVVVVGLVLAVVTAARAPDAPRPVADGRLGTVVATGRAWLVPVVGPVSLFGASVVFIALAAQARWIAGPNAAGASRYLYVDVVLTLPLVALALQALIERWRPLALLVLVVLVGVPGNVSAFDDPPFGPGHHERQEALIRNAVRSPFAPTAPDHLRPDPDVYNSEGLNMGFLRGAVGAGKLRLPTGPIPPPIADELAVRLTLSQERDTDPVGPCQPQPVTRFRPTRGDRFTFAEDLVIRVRRPDGSLGSKVTYRVGDGQTVTVVRSQVDVMIETPSGWPAQICLAPA